jgi:PhnB protein
VGAIREEEAMAVKPVPEGYHTFTPYFVVEGASDFIEFVKTAFSGQEIFRFPAPGGKIGHAEVRVGDSIVMLADATPEYPPALMNCYLYVPDVDATFRKAVAAGARSKRDPANQFYGDRVGTLADRWGNTWSVGTHVEDVPPDEMERRMKAQKK